MLKQGIKVLVTAPQNAAVINILESVAKSNELESALGEYEYVHFTGAYYRVTDAEKLSLQEAAAKAKDFNGQSIQIAADEAAAVADFYNILTEYARKALKDDSRKTLKGDNQPAALCSALSPRQRTSCSSRRIVQKNSSSTRVPTSHLPVSQPHAELTTVASSTCRLLATTNKVNVSSQPRTHRIVNRDTAHPFYLEQLFVGSC
jgi:hypothetical protein